MKPLIILLLLIFLCSCKGDTVSPTGSLKLTFSYYGGLATQTVSYNLYSEASYSTSYTLMSGMMGRTSDSKTNTYEVTLDNLNPGNYYIAASIVTVQNRRLVQVTAGQERSYTF